MNYNLPKQKLKMSQKTKAWGKKHFTVVNGSSLSDGHPFRSKLEHKKRNIKSYNGEIAISDYKLVLNPNNLSDTYMPEAIQHIPIAAPYINTLIGEEAERKSDFRAIATNPTTISAIQEEKQNMLRKKVYELLDDPSINEDEAKEKLKEYQRYLKYSYQDSRERRMNLLLKYYSKQLDLNLKFNEGFKYVTLTSEEAYFGDVVNGEPVIDCINIENIFVLQAGDSKRFEDADLIILNRYRSPNQLLDKYSQYLKPSDVAELEKLGNRTSAGGTPYRSETEAQFAKDALFIDMNKEMIDGFTQLKDLGSNYRDVAGSPYADEFGNIRELTILWASKKLIYRIKYYDEETGQEMFDYRDETYIPNEELGEEVKELWITQWYEGVQIGDSIYPYIRPRRLQFNKIDNPFYNHPGIVGQVYNTGSMRGKSLMDRAMPYQLLYDVTFRKLTTALSKFMGSLIEVDYATMPKGWNITKWIYFADKAGIAVKDSFREGNSGAALGKLAGGMGNNGKVINQDLGNYIEHTISLLEFIETRTGRILGVTPQRLGEVSNRETVGGVERAVTQSSFTTNELYKIHDNVKKRVYTLLIELCKVAFKDNPRAFQYIGDDFQSYMFDIDNEVLEESYGILIDNDNSIAEIEQKMEPLIQAAIQGRTIEFSDVLKFNTTTSISEKMRIIETSEDEAKKREAKMQEQQSQDMQAQSQALKEIEDMRQAREDDRLDKKLAMDKYKIDEDNLTKRLGFNTTDNTLLDPDVDDEVVKYEKELLLKMKDLEEKIRNNKANNAETARHNKATEAISRKNKTNATKSK